MRGRLQHIKSHLPDPDRANVAHVCADLPEALALQPREVLALTTHEVLVPTECSLFSRPVTCAVSSLIVDCLDTGSPLPHKMQQLSIPAAILLLSQQPLH